MPTTGIPAVVTYQEFQKTRAAVAGILRGDREAILIRKTHRTGDTWSEQVVFPDGRNEAGYNKDDLSTCEK